MDRWLQRTSLIAMLALAACLLGVGLSLYLPSASAQVVQSTSH